MKCTIPEISWHNRDPVLGVDLQPRIVSNPNNDIFYRLASCGTDSHVLIWLLTVDKGGIASLECAADLTRHTKTVNCVRFSPSGELLASGDDEGSIIIWKMKSGNDPVDIFNGEEEVFKEQWISYKVLRGHLEDVYDLSWSADSKNLVSGSVDNTAILWDVTTGKNLGILSEHKGFVQGVAWDPSGQYVTTISSDRVCRVYSSATKKVRSRIYKGHLPGADPEAKPVHFFHDDTLKSFFRRLTFTPDGELLIVPSGLVEEKDKKPSNSTVVFSRYSFQKPVMYLPSLSQYTVAVRCCPVLFTPRPMESAPLLARPYRVVFAVATQDSVVLYDTQHAAPFAFVTKIHYTKLTDLTWSSDGRVLVVSSTDGYCSVITFGENELGTVYTSGEKTEVTAGKQPDKDTQTKPTPGTKGASTLAGEDKSGAVENLIVNEDAVMAVDDVIGDVKEDKTVEKSKQEIVALKTTTPAAKDTAMEVDDFQLMYEGTVTEPMLESKTQNASEIKKLDTSKSDNSTETDSKSKETSNKSEKSDTKPNLTTCEVSESDKLAAQAVKSPNKSDETKKIEQEALTSPQTCSSRGNNITPVSSNKKTPRRVQLITLSSPKSKKKLLD